MRAILSGTMAMVAAFLLLAPGAAQAEESLAGQPREADLQPDIPKRVILALGFDSPIGGEGKVIPLVIARLDGDELVAPFSGLRANLDTSTLSLFAESDLWQSVFAGVHASGTAFSGQQAGYRYDGDERVDEAALTAHNAGGGPVLGYRIAPKIDAWAFLDVRRNIYQLPSDAPADLTPPLDHVQWKVGLKAWADRMRTFQSGDIYEGWQASVYGEYFGRDAWAEWGLPDLPQTDRGRNREGARAYFWGRYALRFCREQDLRITAEGGVGWDVDVLTAFRVGSLVGEFSLPGYYYAEVAADRVLLFGARYGRNLWPGGRGWMSFKGGCVREIGGPFRGVAGFSMGLSQKIFLGIPVAVEYGYSPTVGRESGGSGHEILAAVAVGFE